MIDQVEDLNVTDGVKIILDYVETETSSLDILVRSASGAVKKRAYSSLPGVSGDRNIDGGAWDNIYLVSQTVNGGLFT